jgi:hypothetical protein
MQVLSKCEASAFGVKLEARSQGVRPRACSLALLD